MKVHPRGRSAETKKATKAAIREACLNGPKREVQIIPATHELNLETEKKKLRVCAYCRVSTDEDAQAGSYELQVQHYTQLIQKKMKIGSSQVSMRMKVFPLHLLNIGRNSFDMLEKFTVIDLIRTRSDSVATITGSAVKFNIQTAAELNYPAYVQFLIEQKNKQFAVRVC